MKKLASEAEMTGDGPVKRAVRQADQDHSGERREIEMDLYGRAAERQERQLERDLFGIY